MSVTVRTATDGDDDWTATHWRVEDGHLWVCAVDHLLAEYPPGQWTAVWRANETADEAPAQAGVNRGGGDGDLIPGAVGIVNDRARTGPAPLAALVAMLDGAWAMDRITRGAITIDVLRELRNALGGVTA